MAAAFEALEPGASALLGHWAARRPCPLSGKGGREQHSRQQHWNPAGTPHTAYSWLGHRCLCLTSATGVGRGGGGGRHPLGEARGQEQHGSSQRPLQVGLVGCLQARVLTQHLPSRAAVSQGACPASGACCAGAAAPGPCASPSACATCPKQPGLSALHSQLCWHTAAPAAPFRHGTSSGPAQQLPAAGSTDCRWRRQRPVARQPRAAGGQAPCTRTLCSQALPHKSPGTCPRGRDLDGLVQAPAHIAGVPASQVGLQALRADHSILDPLHAG